jgi:hypothetical protein
LNAHHLTADAQSALRRCIEQFSYNTRFFIVVENKNKLLTPILSRFCDIYVPEYVDPITNTCINMHHYVLDRAFAFRPELKLEKRRIIDRIMEPRVNKISGLVSGLKEETGDMEKATIMYESGVSGLDLMDWIRTTGGPASIHKATIEMRFHTMKTEFRCEKLLMLFLLTELKAVSE